MKRESLADGVDRIARQQQHPADFWRLLLGDAYPEQCFRIGNTLFARDGNTVLELAPYANGVQVTVHAGFIKTQDFPFCHYFSPAGPDRLVPRLVSKLEGWVWHPVEPSELALGSIRDALREYINLWSARK